MPITLAAMLLWFLVMIPLLRNRVKYYMERPRTVEEIVSRGQCYH
jgi:hypothetical protein